MTYVHLAIYDPITIEFVGFVIKDDHAQKLQSTNIYREGEEQTLRDQLDRLNTQTSLNRYWPHPRDPDVLVLLDDPHFNPIEYEEQDVVDEENSHYVYKKVAGTTLSTEREWVDSDEVDEDASTIVYKKAMVPKRPTDVMWRIKAACEQVARRRAGLV